MTEPNQIVLTPNYEGLFKVMLDQAILLADASTLLYPLLADERRGESLRAIQSFLAPLNIAAQCMTTAPAVEKFREALNRIVQDIDRTAGQLEAERDADKAERQARRFADLKRGLL